MNNILQTFLEKNKKIIIPFVVVCSAPILTSIIYRVIKSNKVFFGVTIKNGSKNEIDIGITIEGSCIIFLSIDKECEYKVSDVCNLLKDNIHKLLDIDEEYTKLKIEYKKNEDRITELSNKNLELTISMDEQNELKKLKSLQYLSKELSFDFNIEIGEDYHFQLLFSNYVDNMIELDTYRKINGVKKDKV